MKRFKVISSEHAGCEYIGRVFTGPVVVKLGWRDLNEGLKLLFYIDLGQQVVDDDGWVWERIE